MTIVSSAERRFLSRIEFGSFFWYDSFVSDNIMWKIHS